MVTCYPQIFDQFIIFWRFLSQFLIFWRCLMVTCYLTIWPVYDLLKVYDSNSLSGSDLLKMLDSNFLLDYLLWSIYDLLQVFDGNLLPDGSMEVNKTINKSRILWTVQKKWGCEIICCDRHIECTKWKYTYTELAKEDISIQRRWEGLRPVKCLHI